MLKIFRPRINLRAMTQVHPTSKFDLKLQCIAIARGDITEAERIYNFFASDLTLPDVTPPLPTLMEQVKSTAGGIFNFVRDNRDDIAQALSYVQSLRAGTTAAPPATELPPLPPINP